MVGVSNWQGEACDRIVVPVKRDEIQFPAKHEALRDDVHALGEMIGQVLQEQGGDQLYELVEQDRRLAIRRREGDAAAGEELAVRLRGRPPAEAADLVRAFSAWFRSVNLAEMVHRVRRRRAYFIEVSMKPQPGGVVDALTQLHADGVSLEQVLELLAKVRIEPVFTAHPTESTRRTILRKQQRVAELLLDRLDPTLTPQEMRALWDRILSETTTAWQTEDHPRDRLTVADEREHVIFYLAEILYRILPTFYDELAQGLEKLYGVPAESLELPTIIRFGSWVGGDMDGSPDVHAKSIRETLARHQQVIVNEYFNDCQRLAQLLSQSASRIGILPALQARIEQYGTLLPHAQSVTPARHDRMPYRVFLTQIAERLRHTYDGRPNAYEGPAQLLRDVRLIAASLKANRGANAGYYNVMRLIRRIETFGFHLATLDVRQHADIHHYVIGMGLGDPEWSSRTSNDRRDRLVQLIENDAGHSAELDALGKRTLSVFEAIMQCRHRYGPEAVGYYVVSGAAGADDVLAPLLLARWAEAYDKRTDQVALDVAPLFLSIDTLARCGEIMQTLLSGPIYRRHLDSRSRTQCALVGYSDSNKEGGVCAARFAIWQAQRDLAATLTAADETHVIFHNRGGSIARGGGRIDTLVRSAPASAINGVLRLTEQGEAINQSYGLRPIALRTVERAFSALSLATARSMRGQLASDNTAHIPVCETMVAASYESYRRLVSSDKTFFEYFETVTPIDVIARMQIGSRSAQRPDKQGFEGLRSVPWVFAWTQSRFALPAWYGAGAGLEAAIEQHGIDAVRSAYQEWSFFGSLIDDIETSVARADLTIATYYNDLAFVSLQRFFIDIRREYDRLCERILELKNQRRLLDHDRTLQRSIELRNPYIDPMHLMQIDLLQRWRATGRKDRQLFDALVVTVSGIAQGLQSTG